MNWRNGYSTRLISTRDSADKRFTPQNTLLLENTLLQSGLVHFASQLIFLLNICTYPDNTLYSSAHFSPEHTLLLSSLYSSSHFASWNTLLPGTLYFLEDFALTVTGCKVCWGKKVANMQKIPGSKVCWEAKISREKSVPGSKVCLEVKCSREQIVHRSRVFQRESCVEGQTALGSKVWVCKVFPRSKVFLGAKCVSAVICGVYLHTLLT